MIISTLRFLPAGIKEIPAKISFDEAYLEYGFDVDARLAASWKQGSSNDVRRGYNITNKMSYFGNYEGESVQDVNILDGYNLKLVQTATDQLATDAAEKIGSEMPCPTLGRVAAMANADLFKLSNMITPIYNLLCMYYLHSFDIKTPYDPNAFAYDDGQIKMANKDMYGEEAGAHPNLSEYEGMFSISDPVERKNLSEPCSSCEGEYTNYFLNLYDTLVVALPPYTSQGQMHAILAALSGWKSHTALGVGHSRPKCADSVVFTGPTNQPTIIGSYTKADIKAALCAMVSENRLFTDFRHALGMLTQVLLTPVPRRIEASVWVSIPRRVRLPRARCVRGIAFSGILEGEPFCKDSQANAEFKFWCEWDSTVVSASLMLAEAAHLGLAALTAAPIKAAVNVHNYHEKASKHALSTKTPLLNDMLLLCMHYETAFDIHYASRCGMVRFVDRGEGALAEIKILYSPSANLSGYNLRPISGNSQPGYGAEVPIPDSVLAELSESSRKLLEGMKIPNPTNPKVNELFEAILSVGNMPSPVYPVYLFDAKNPLSVTTLTKSLFIEPNVSSAAMIILDSPHDYSVIMDFCNLAGWDQTAVELVSGDTQRSYIGDSEGRFMHGDWLLPDVFLVALRNDTLRRRTDFSLTHLKVQAGGELSYVMENRSYFWYKRGNLSAPRKEIIPQALCDYFKTAADWYGLTECQGTGIKVATWSFTDDIFVPCKAPVIPQKMGIR